MKKNDIFLIIIIALISVMVSYFVLSSLIGNAEFGTIKVPTVELITPVLVEPDVSIFNSEAINPSVEVNISQQEGT